MGTGGGMAAVKLTKTMILMVSENSNTDIVMAEGF